MKRLFLISLFCQLFILPTFSQTEDSPLYVGVGAHYLHVYMKNTPDVEKIGGKIAVGFEDWYAFSTQLEFSSKWLFWGAGIGYRPLHKKLTRFQPMMYCLVGITSLEKSKTDSIGSSNGWNSADVKTTKTNVAYFTVTPEISLDYYVGARVALGLYANKSFILSSNASYESTGNTRILGGIEGGIMLKLFIKTK